MIELWTDEDLRRRPELQETLEAALVVHNRQIAADRERWPFGALSVCEILDAEYPGWIAFWRRANTNPGWEHPAGFVARRESSGYVCGADPVALVKAMHQAPWRRHPHYHGRCCPLVPTSEQYAARLIAAALADTGR